MLIELIYKEFKNELNITSENKVIKIFNILLKLVFISLFISLEVFIFLSVDKKISNYSSYGTYDFLLFFLFIMMVITIFSSLLKARKVLFNKLDSEVLFILPISNSTLVFSKLVFIYIKSVLLNLIISTPLLITYGSTREFMPYYYIFSLLYPFIISLFIIGVSLILLIPYEYLYKLIKLNDYVQFILASILAILLCFIYKYVLELFLNALNNSSIGGMFSKKFIDVLHNITKYFYPISNIFNSYIKSMNRLSNTCLFVGGALIIFVIGWFITTFYYNKLNKNELNFSRLNVNKKEKEIKVLTPSRALIKKEFILLFKDSTNIFSYTALLIMAPFLSFVVISSLNEIMYKSLRSFIIYFPELINALNICLILLFSGVINASASLSISRENKAKEIIKYIPLSPIKQILIKILIPFILSSASLIITTSILVSLNVISKTCFVTSTVIGLILILFTNIFGIYLDMKDLSTSKVKFKSIISIINLIYPLILFIIEFLLSYYKLNKIIINLLIIFLSIILIIPLFIKFNSRVNKAFYEMEVD